MIYVILVENLFQSGGEEITMNKVELIGRMTSDPDMRGEGTGLCARFTLAVPSPYKEEADFIRCVAFGKIAEIIERWTVMGKKVAVVGHIQTGKYVNKDGITIHTSNVVVEFIDFLDNRKPEREDVKSDTELDTGFIPDDLPF